MEAQLVAWNQTTISARQVTLAESIERTRTYSTSDVQALRVSKRIGEMITRDSIPFLLSDFLPCSKH